MLLVSFVSTWFSCSKIIVSAPRSFVAILLVTDAISKGISIPENGQAFAFWVIVLSASWIVASGLRPTITGSSSMAILDVGANGSWLISLTFILLFDRVD